MTIVKGGRYAPKARILSAYSALLVLVTRHFLPAIATLLLGSPTLLPGRAAAAVFEDFETYAVGSNLHGQGGWAGWTGDPGAGALVSSNYSFSPIRSVNISGARPRSHGFRRDQRAVGLASGNISFHFDRQ
jgi:hypothetical protein